DKSEIINISVQNEIIKRDKKLTKKETKKYIKSKNKIKIKRDIYQHQLDLISDSSFSFSVSDDIINSVAKKWLSSSD
ncbi:hypothetical protein, partial [Neptunomonas phycophila]|uniref:hypothetical protein n=1 Tax=Neptunomonas phycophila TaxID=1572645 RepID=UPI000ACB1663